MSSHTPDVRSDYLYHALNPASRAVIVRNCVEVLKRMEFDAIAFRGMSGALIAPLVAQELGCSVIMVRKPNENSHSCYKVEGDRAAKSYVIIDDFISSGRTVEAIIEGIRDTDIQAECLGVLEYGDARPSNFEGKSPNKVLPNGATVRILIAPNVLHGKVALTEMLHPF